MYIHQSYSQGDFRMKRQINKFMVDSFKGGTRRQVTVKRGDNFKVYHCSYASLCRVETLSYRPYAKANLILFESGNISAHIEINR